MTQITVDTVDFDDSRFGPLAEPLDPIEQMALADRADWMLLRLVLCASAATLMLAVASSLSR